MVPKGGGPRTASRRSTISATSITGARQALKKTTRRPSRGSARPPGGNIHPPKISSATLQRTDRAWRKIRPKRRSFFRAAAELGDAQAQDNLGGSIPSARVCRWIFPKPGCADPQRPARNSFAEKRLQELELIMGLTRINEAKRPFEEYRRRKSATPKPRAREFSRIQCHCSTRWRFGVRQVLWRFRTAFPKRREHRRTPKTQASDRAAREIENTT